MKKLQIFEPAMCCATGLCGVGVDTELLRISTVLSTLEKKGIKVERFNLSNTPMEFITNETVNNFLKDKGAEGLPISVLDGEIVITGRYPSNEELTKLLELPADVFEGQPKLVKATFKKSSGCGCSEGTCC